MQFQRVTIHCYTRMTPHFSSNYFTKYSKATNSFFHPFNIKADSTAIFQNFQSRSSVIVGLDRSGYTFAVWNSKQRPRVLCMSITAHLQWYRCLFKCYYFPCSVNVIKRVNTPVHSKYQQLYYIPLPSKTRIIAIVSNDLFVRPKYYNKKNAEYPQESIPRKVNGCLSSLNMRL